jgi:hypothetical protein
MFGYDDKGSSSSPCSPEYRGASAFSEPETQVVREFVNSRNLRLWLHFDGSGAATYRPFCYKNSDSLFTNADDLAFYDDLVDEVYDDLQSYAEASGVANGKLLDWAYNKTILALEVGLTEARPKGEEILQELKGQDEAVDGLLEYMTAEFM